MSFSIDDFFSLSRHNERHSENLETPVVPSLALSVPSIIANSSPPDHPVVIRSRSDADGEEPSLSPPPPTTTLSPVLHSMSETSRTAIRQPADGLGNPSTTTRTHEDHPLVSWSSNDEDEDDDDEQVPPSSRLRPVLIGGEDNPQYHHSDDDDENNNTLLTNLSLNPPN